MWGEYYSGAGIGGASSYGDAKNITITGNADVTAAGGYYSAGIGGSEYGNATNITISGNAEVTASGSHSAGAGIGGGEDGMGTDILIKDDAKVTAYAGYGSAGIGAAATGEEASKFPAALTPLPLALKAVPALVPEKMCMGLRMMM